MAYFGVAIAEECLEAGGNSQECDEVIHYGSRNNTATILGVVFSSMQFHQSSV